MQKKVEVLGMEIDNYNAREALELVDVLQDSGEFFTIGTITTGMLRAAEKDQDVRECIKGLSLAVLGETEILRALGIETTERRRETEDHVFFHELLKRMVRNRKRVCILSDTGDRLNDFTTYLSLTYERMDICSGFSLDNCGEDWDNIVNDINAEAPDAVLSVIRTPVQEEFLLRNKKRLGCGLWYGVGDSFVMREKTFGRFLRRAFRSSQLKRRLRNGNIV